MTNSNDDGAPRPQAVVAGDLDGAGAVPAHRCSRSAAPTAMTIRLQARRRKIPLSHVELAVSYHHGADGGRDSFERSITLEGNLVDDERAQLMQSANMCP